jgi:general stress protein 26
MKSHAFSVSQLLAAAALIVAIGAPANAVTSQRDGDALSSASYLYIATVRKDGNQSKAARVWFIATADGQILIDTNSDSWKAKRIARGSPVIVWIGSSSGPAFIGKGKIVADRAVQDQMIEAIPKKYLLARMGMFGPKRERFDSGQIVTIRISPERDLPEGFQSQPGTPAPALSVKEPPPRVSS